MKSVLVTGVRGKTGRQVLPPLPPKTASRFGAQARNATDLPGVLAVRFDWDEPTNWADVLRGVSAIYLVKPKTQDPASTVMSFLRLASEAERIVLLSEVGCESREINRPTNGRGCGPVQIDAVRLDNSSTQLVHAEFRGTQFLSRSCSRQRRAEGPDGRATGELRRHPRHCRRCVCCSHGFKPCKARLYLDGTASADLRRGRRENWGDCRTSGQPHRSTARRICVADLMSCNLPNSLGDLGEGQRLRSRQGIGAPCMA